MSAGVMTLKHGALYPLLEINCMSSDDGTRHLRGYTNKHRPINLLSICGWAAFQSHWLLLGQANILEKAATLSVINV